MEKQEDYLEGRMKTAYFPGKAMFGEKWLRSAKTDTSMTIVMVERHQNTSDAQELQRKFGKNKLVIAMNNEERVTAGCARCPSNWHREVEKQGG